ncbi:dienelactone hydrolase family protein [Paenibacillus montanisoli]|uniref:Dienelactone hydrolase domain-containing protein n=1 Tax=Paenibacillus montanisoli TaxID=2081970 RepID=A0A328TVT4_9BACL|nr:dienelactone hydrolase family protein [Paenibacillus montanisoli]RAP73613.1 hypothetical protein DL346_25410 [Paenibacillus montanisoli]
MNTDQFTKHALVILLHEIYGVNDHMAACQEMMLGAGFDAIVPNLLHREAFSYDEEELAHTYFVGEIGFAKAKEEVKQIINEYRAGYERIYLVGFSAGATLAWLCSEDQVDGVIGFYGSRIRNYVETEPHCPTLLFFSRHETSFDVPDLAAKLQASKKNLTVEIVDADHGFMNPFDKSFQQEHYRRCLDRSFDFFRSIEGDTEPLDS